MLNYIKQAMADGTLAIFCNNWTEIQYVREFCVTQCGLPRPMGDKYDYNRYPYVVYYGSVTGWTGEGQLNSKDLNKINYDEFYNHVNGIHVEDELIADASLIL